MNYKVNYLHELESEAIHVLLESYSQFESTALLFSGGKDSIVVAHLLKKAFWPAKIPIPFIHIDTGHNFPETIIYRDTLIDNFGVKLIVGSVQNSINEGRVKEEIGNNANRNSLQTITLLDTIEKYSFDACIGGARRDEEKARAKERFFSHRDSFGQWNPKNQRPELWSLFNGKKNMGENIRVFPISNWTEIDVWNYIKSEKIQLPSLYFSHKRKVFFRNGTWISDSPYVQRKKDEILIEKDVRFRTCGDITITGAIESKAFSVEEVINEISNSRLTERGTRADDKISETSMEDRKKMGYF